MTRTPIEWCRNQDGSQGFTVNPIRFRNKETGKVGHYCEKVSPGCKNCYASRMQKGPYLSGLEFTAENKDRGELFFDENVCQQVLRRQKPSTFFWCDMTDLFGDWVLEEWQIRCLATMIGTPQHRHLILTKRSHNMRRFFTLMTSPGYGCLVGNIGLGVSAEDQERADERIEHLKATPAAMRFVSGEPLLGPISYRWAKWEPLKIGLNGQFDGLRGIDWVIVGGESGPEARPMHPDWARSVRDQCQAAGVPFFFKQWGEWAPAKTQIVEGCLNRTNGVYQHEFDPTGRGPMMRIGKKSAGRTLDGRIWDEMPEMLK